MKTAAPASYLRGSRRLPRTGIATVDQANSQVPVKLFLTLVLSWFAVAASAQIISPANLPLYFEANNTQTEFLSSGNGYQFGISASGVNIALRESKAHTAMAQMQFVGASAMAQIHGGDEMAGKVNYFIGNDSTRWQRGLPTFGNVQVTQLYPGINMVFHGNQRQLEYDFTIAPGANPNAIKMRFTSVDKVSVTLGGDLLVTIGNHELIQPKPEIYQTMSGHRETIAGGYKILDSRTVAFETAAYDHTLPLVIDPVLGYSAFFAGNVGDTATALALGPNNSICIAGETFSTEFSTVGAAQTNFAGGKYNGDAFVAKMDQTGTNLIYLTYLGGMYDDAAFGLAVDANGNAFITGYTDSPNFPTNNAIFPTIPGKRNPLFGNAYPSSAFVAELDSNGTNLIYSTYLGGSNENVATSIAVDSSDNAYVVGYTYSPNFFVTNAFQSHLACSNNVDLNANGFLTEIASNGTSIPYSTYLGGTNYDAAEDVALNTNNNDVVVVGYTGSFNFPTNNTPAAYPNTMFLSGKTNRFSFDSYDGFVTEFPPLSTNPTNLIYSMFLGGTNNDAAYGVAVDAAGNAYVTGWTASTNFPVTNAPPGLWSFVTTNGTAGAVATNAFLTKISSVGSQTMIDNSVVFGALYLATGYKVAVDPAGDAFVVGWENATNFPTTNTFGSLLSTNSRGGFDAFVTGVSADWSSVLYSACLGGNANTYGYGIAVDSSTNVYLTGITASTNYPTFNSGRYWFNGTNVINGANYMDGTRFTGTNDSFVTKIILAPTEPIISPIEPTNLIVGYGASVTLGATVTASTQQIVYSWKRNGATVVNGGRISGADSPALTITNAQPGDSSTNYVLTISYGGGMSYPAGEYTQSNILTVLGMPYITTALTNQVVYAGTNVSFSIVASGAPLTYSWSTNGYSAITNNPQFSGTTSNTLTVYNVATNNSGFYYVLIQNPNGASYTNDYAYLTVVEPLSIVTAPTNETVGSGSTVSFTVGAIGYPLSYQWSTNDGTTFLTNGDNISGSTTSTLTITNVQTSQAGTYTVFVNNVLQTNDVSAVLTVLPGPSFTGFTADPSGNGMVLTGSGGANVGTYTVLTSTNIALPMSQWTPVATNQFDSQGNFSFTNVATNASQFFILKQR